MIIYVVGIPGVGKSSVLKKAQEKLKNFKIINFGDLVFEKVKDKVKSRDEIVKKLKREEYLKIQIEVARELKGAAKNLIIDTHLTLYTPFGFYPGIHKFVAREIPPDLIIVITADPKEIYLRRIRDKNRQRGILDIEILKLWQDFEIFYATNIMYEYDSYLKIIENREGLLNEAAEELVKTIYDLL